MVTLNRPQLYDFDTFPSSKGTSMQNLSSSNSCDVGGNVPLPLAWCSFDLHFFGHNTSSFSMVLDVFCWVNFHDTHYTGQHTFGNINQSSGSRLYLER